MKNILRVAVLSLFLVSGAFGEEASDESIRELMNKTGAGDLGVQMMGHLLPHLQQMIPDAPAEFWDDFMSKVDPDDLIEKVIPIYKKHFSEEDIKAVIEFYDTPVGKKFIKAQPSIVQESSAVGQEWGREIAQQVMEEYAARNK